MNKLWNFLTEVFKTWIYFEQKVLKFVKRTVELSVGFPLSRVYLTFFWFHPTFKLTSLISWNFLINCRISKELLAGALSRAKWSILHTSEKYPIMKEPKDQMSHHHHHHHLLEHLHHDEQSITTWVRLPNLYFCQLVALTRRNESEPPCCGNSRDFQLSHQSTWLSIVSFPPHHHRHFHHGLDHHNHQKHWNQQ